MRRSCTLGYELAMSDLRWRILRCITQNQLLYIRRRKCYQSKRKRLFFKLTLVEKIDVITTVQEELREQMES